MTRILPHSRPTTQADWNPQGPDWGHSRGTNRCEQKSRCYKALVLVFTEPNMSQADLKMVPFDFL